MNKRILLFVFIFIIVLGMGNSIFAEPEYDLIKLKEGIRAYGKHAYNDGLIPVVYEGSISENGNWAYMTEEGNVFSHKYANGFEYSEGLAPIIREVYREDGSYLELGYIDRKGRTVIEPSFDVYHHNGITYGGRFKDGQALVFKYDESKKDSHSIPGYWYRIDRSGNRIDEKEVIETKDLLFSDSRDSRRLYNDSYSVNYDTEETVKIFGERIENIRFNKNRAVVNVDRGENQGSYIVRKKDRPAKELRARRSDQKIFLNNQEVEIDAYLIQDNNYFKLRDLAYILKDTNKKFEVKWNPEMGDIDLYSGKNYSPVGGEMEVSGRDLEKPIETRSAIYLDGSSVDIKAYKIANNNYFKIRDICRILDIGIYWDEINHTIRINTELGYSD